MSNQVSQEFLNKLKDPVWRLNHLYKIKTKDKKLQIFKQNKAQQHYLQNKSNKDCILKARQLGFSTEKLIEQVDYAITNRNVNCAIIAHEREKVTKLFEIVKRAYDYLPQEVEGIPIKPKASYDNRNELYFPELDSKIFVAMDTRSETVHNLHVSEAAFIPQAEERMTGILESVPEDGVISIETTANGMTGWFYDLWEERNSEFKKHFYPWFWDEEYQKLTDVSLEDLLEEYRGLTVRFGLIPDLYERFNLTKEQLNWYIQKVYRQKALIVQEYPSSDLEAFISSGRNVFHISDLQKHQSQEPIERKWQDLLIWEKPLPGQAYVIGCDPSEGIGQDNAVIEVLNAYTGEQVAEFATNNCPPDILGGYLIDIGNYYNKAFIVLEINNHGLVVLNKIKNKYYNIYRREVFDKVSKNYTQALGWKTTGVTKPLLVQDLEEAIRIEDIRINSNELLKECKTFVRSDESGKQGYGAEGSAKDDRVIAIGLAFQGIKHLPAMKAPKTEAQRKLEEYIRNQQLVSQGAMPQIPQKKRNYAIRGIIR